jgi:Ca2+-binding RTX toxin-like protein
LLGGSGTDQITGGTGSDTVTGGTGNDTFFLAKGDLVQTAPGAVYDVITDFERTFGGTGSHDLLRLTGFSGKAAIQYVGDTPTGLHDYLVTDGPGFSAHLLLGYGGAGSALLKNLEYIFG